MSRRPIPLPPRAVPAQQPMPLPPAQARSPPRAQRGVRQPPSVKGGHRRAKQAPPRGLAPPPLAEGNPAPLQQIFSPIEEVEEPLPLPPEEVEEPLPPEEVKKSPQKKPQPPAFLAKIFEVEEKTPQPVPVAEFIPLEPNALPLPGGVVRIGPSPVCSLTLDLPLPEETEEVPPLPGVKVPLPLPLPPMV